MDSKISQRRQFLKLLGYTALSVQILPLTGGALAVETAPADSLAVTSSRNSKLGRWAYHSHILYVPLQLFRAPPQQGVTLSTTWTFRNQKCGASGWLENGEAHVEPRNARLYHELEYAYQSLPASASSAA